MDNRYFGKNCPSKMSDGRFVTSYVPRDSLEKTFVEKMNAMNEHDYRKKLQENAVKIITENKTQWDEKFASCNSFVFF